MVHRVLLLLLLITTGTFSISQKKKAQFNFAVVGAGPAGIIAVALLRDLGLRDNQILWVDPEFNVGRLSHYPTVPGNLQNKILIKFLQSVKTFQEISTPAIHALLHIYDPEKEYPLQVIIDPLQDITNYLRTKIISLQSHFSALDFIDDVWQLTIDNKRYSAEHVILAIGSHPRRLDYDNGKKTEIPLDSALDKATLAQLVTKKDIIAVVGSAHSAILILKFLSELPVARIINFYTQPIKYVTDMGGWNLHQEEGLKGITAQWAKQVLEKNPPKNLKRIFNTPAALKKWLRTCTKIIYACGFVRNELPPINGKTSISYNDTTGVIAPRLFGFGIAFPQKITDPQGNSEHRVGLPFFLSYARQVIPQWIATKEFIESCNSFDSLFAIDLL